MAKCAFGNIFFWIESFYRRGKKLYFPPKAKMLSFGNVDRNSISTMSRNDYLKNDLAKNVFLDAPPQNVFRETVFWRLFSRGGISDDQNRFEKISSQKTICWRPTQKTILWRSFFVGVFSRMPITQTGIAFQKRPICALATNRTLSVSRAKLF